MGHKRNLRRHPIGPRKAPVPAVPKERRVFLAIPTGSGNPEYSNNLTMNRVIMESSERGWKVDLIYRAWDSMITRARDVLFSQFIASDCTDMLFLDDDIGARPGSFARLMEHPVDLVGGAYRGRLEPEEYVIRALPGTGALQFDPEQKTGLMEVEAIGTGFLRITRAAAERMVQAHSDDWYYDHTAPRGMKIYSLFDNYFDRANRQKWSEDYWFCKRYREAGGKVWVDPFLTLDHTGKKMFTGNLLDYLKRTNPEAPVSLVKAVKDMIALPAPELPKAHAEAV